MERFNNAPRLGQLQHSRSLIRLVFCQAIPYSYTSFPTRSSLESVIGQIIIWALPVLLAVVFHEVSHGWVAYRLGDPTARQLGRLTLNPIAHVDLFGTILVPLMLIIAHSPFVFGYAKPVPVNFNNLRNPKRDMIWVAVAGPVTNLLLAAACTLIWRALLRNA